MIESGLVIVGTFLFYALVSIVSILLVWIVCGAVFCTVVCTVSHGSCAACAAVRRRLAHHQH